MNKICLQEDQISNMVEALLVYSLPEKNLCPFIDKDEALTLLKCSSGTLQKLRDEDLIEFYWVRNRHIIYSYSSIMKYVKSKSNMV
ncbi:hypothetical protein [Ekhidna sp.]|uniref:hypothetical protein n=1 Tax=Ekhidna sp. TaxID=2608089 RepID=UPI003296CBAD